VEVSSRASVGALRSAVAGALGDERLRAGAREMARVIAEERRGDAAVAALEGI
jgi:hypothetical protein